VGRRLTSAPGLLPRDFFDRPVLEVAPDLLGCVLRHETPDGAVAVQLTEVVAVRLTEVEAYAGEADPASHAYRGRTARNAVMFGEPGHAYVYFTYGMHFCVNLVCGPPGVARAVLLRAGRVTEGVALAASRRSAGRAAGRGGAERDLARGPARLCQALRIDRSLDGADVCGDGLPLRVCGRDGPAAAVSEGPRVGVSRGAEEPWRFWVTGDPTVSVYRPHVPRRRLPA
jgi:DNA-3-methyladenine glycosylase